MSENALRRLLSPLVTFRQGELLTGMLMFAYSFLAMTAYNNIRPSATSKFISDLGSENLPWVYLIAGVTLGVLLQHYSRLVGRVPWQWVFPGTQLGIIVLLVGFWLLLKTEQAWVSAAFYFWGRMLLGIFLISQFWNLASVIYDARQAKRVFGFIYGGASLGGLTGATLTTVFAERVGTDNLLLISTVALILCFVIILRIQRREEKLAEEAGARSVVTQETVSAGEALQMLRESKHLRIIALLIGFAALGGLTVEQQLNMSLDELVSDEDARTKTLGIVGMLLSAISFVVQVGLVSRIHRNLGIGFAMLVVPVSLAASAVLILFNPFLWATGAARVLDTSLRYSVNKTTGEVLFLPIPAAQKFRAKAFVDVTADRFLGKGLGGAILLLLLNVLGVSWWQLSYLSLGCAAVWIVLTRKARREYMAVFRRSIENLELEPERLAPPSGDPATVETLVEELGSLDEHRVLRSIELLESLDKRSLVTPLLLRHESARVRERALEAVDGSEARLLARWRPAVERSLKDDDPGVRARAVQVLASLQGRDVTELMRSYLGESDPRMASAAAVVLARSERGEDRRLAEVTLERLVNDGRESAAPARREAARAIARCSDPRFRQLLIPLMHDGDTSVALEAIRSAGRLGDGDYLFVPSLVSLLRDRRLKIAAREALVGHGEGVVSALGHFLGDESEDPWVRRHIPSTLALIPSSRSAELLIDSLASDDGFLRFKAICALEHIRQVRPELAMAPEAIEKITVQELKRYYRHLGAGYNLFDRGGLERDSLLGDALFENRERALDRAYRLLGLFYDPNDIRAARLAIERGDARTRASAIEYLDNTASGRVRKMLLPILDEAIPERVRKGNVFLKTRAKSVEETLARLIYDDDAAIAATAIDVVREKELWSLAADLEQVLQFRSATDFAVFQAASEALAELRAPATPGSPAPPGQARRPSAWRPGPGTRT